MSYDSGELDDLAWPVTTADCALLIAFSIATLTGCGAMAAWMLANIWSLG